MSEYAWHGKEIIMKSTDGLKPYPRNTKKHSQAQVDQIAASIKRFGFINPILIDGEGVIVAGHGRHLAAKLLGMAQVPTLLIDHLSTAERRAYAIIDNRLPEHSEWDFEALTEEVNKLLGGGFTYEDLGFDEALFKELESKVVPEGESLKAADLTDIIPEKYEILVECKTEDEQAQLLYRLDAEGYKCRSLIS